MKLAKIMLFVTDLDEARRFYAEVLGFEISSEAHDHLTFSGAGCEMVAFRCEKAGEVGDYAHEARSVLVFSVQSIEEAFRDLRARGVRFLHSAPAENELGRYAAFVDPFGIVHEILEKRCPDDLSVRSI